METDDTGQGNTPQGVGTGNPAWNNLLSLVPEDQHSQAQEILSEWDKGVQEQFTSRAKQVEPYKQFIENKANPQELAAGMQLLDAIRTQPQEVFKALAEQVGPAEAQKILGMTPAPETDDIPDELKELEKHPLFQEMKSRLDSVDNRVNESQQQALVDQEMEAIATEIATTSAERFDRDLKPFEEQHVILAMLQGATAEQAFDSLVDYHKELGIESPTREKPPAPTVLGGQGRVPQGSVDPAKMSDSQRKHSAVDLLKRVNAANQDKG